MTKLEDLLLPDNLQTKKKSSEGNFIEFDLESQDPEHFKQVHQVMNLIRGKKNFISVDEDDAGLSVIIDDGGITNIPLTLDEIQELESANYPNAGYEVFDNWVPDNHDDEKDGIYNGHVFVSNSQLQELEKFDNEDSTFQAIFGMSKGEYETISNKFIEAAVDNNINQFNESKLPLYLMNDAEIVGYPDEEMQKEIYSWVKSKLSNLEYTLFKDNFDFSVKDLGCGRGDFFDLFIKTIYKIDYIGIDSNPYHCKIAEQKYPGIKIINADFNDVSIQTDYTICIGTLNDDHGFDKWEYFNKTLNHALNNTKTAILFVLQANCYGEPGHLDYPIHELIEKLSAGTRFEIDNSKFEDIYLLTVHIGGFN